MSTSIEKKKPLKKNMKNSIRFNTPFISGKEIEYIQQSIAAKKISGNGDFTQRCQKFFESRYHFKKCLLTTSCTDALEMSAILIDIKPGDEVIMPSFTFVSTANAFMLRGAKIVFIDSEKRSPNLDVEQIEKLVTEKTKAIVVVHYAGIACNMDRVMEIANRHKLFVIEDAAQAIDSYYKTKPLGSIGHFGCFSFHETKNISCGEGGMLAINDEQFIKRAEIVWEKGTNRAAFYRGETDKYTWVDIGSSFLMADLLAAFLYAQLECIDDVQEKRKKIWNYYYEKLKPLEERKKITLPFIPEDCTNNAHIFYVLCPSEDERNLLIDHLQKNGILAIFHYLPLHRSPYYIKSNNEPDLPYSNYFSGHLIRLPLYYSLSDNELNYIVQSVQDFFDIHD
jgi:dTDP-4-amino-4,6-dideoxygalactose transaminase